MFHQIIFLLLTFSSLSCNFNHFAVNVSVVHEHRLQEYSKCRAYQTFFQFTHRYKTLKYKINTIIFLLCCSVTLLMFIQTLHSLQPAGRYIGGFGNYFSGFAKSPRVLWSSWMLNECNLYFKIVKYCILSEGGMIKTAPHSTVSPHMWCIKSITSWFTRPQICKKDSAFQEFVFQA